MLSSILLAAVAATTGYRVAMPDPGSHFFQVQVRYERVTGPLTFRFASFTPGGWRIDEVAKNVMDLTASDGRGKPLAAEKIDTKSWSIGKPVDGVAVVSYRIYANERGTPYAARLNDRLAHANLACILGYVPERQRAPAKLTVVPFGDWTVSSSLGEAPDARGAYGASDFDALADGIVIAGHWTEMAFTEGGTRFRLAFSQPPEVGDRKVVDDVRAIVRESGAVFGEVPFDRYLFVFLLEPETGRGGIEHQYGTSICMPADSFTEREDYRRFLGVTAHEYFHAWNVKRMRPAGLGPFDYTKEAPTHNLYVAEGFTSYYGPVAQVRGGAITREEYFKALAESLVTDRNNAGAKAKSLESFSWDWWLVSDIPYLTFRTNYTRGALVALVLDLEIREATRGARSMDDVMRGLFRRTGLRATGYTDAELREALARDGAPGMDARLDALVKSPGSLDVAAALARAGIEVVPDPETPLAPLVGWRSATKGADFPVIDWVEPGSPAAKAGLQDRDVLLSLGGRKVTAEKLDRELARLTSGKPVEIAFFRDNVLRRIELVPGEPIAPKLLVRDKKDATDEQKALGKAWLAARAPQPAK